MKTLVALFAFVTLAISIQAQNMWGFNAKVYQTKGDFNKNVEAVPVGFSFNFLRGVNEKFAIGAELGIAMYANNEYEYETSSGPITIFEEDCFWTFHGDFRYFFYRTPTLKAYLQARLGLTTFFSSRTPEEETPEFRETFDFHGTAFNTGLGGGMLINCKSLFKKQPGSLNLDLGVALHSGSSTDYRYMGEGSQSVSLDDGIYQSVTNYIDYRIGFVFVPEWRD
ncbi:MAG: hypothetical protein OEU76_06245 [Cyclobacteriaceae bacterium]|nr:hypothetical protein [Cyclobacteriaceae bacterium]